MENFCFKRKLVICGVGGSGKDYFIKYIRKHYDYKIAKKTTTRPRRINETDDDYYFESNETLSNLSVFQEFDINGTKWVYGFMESEIDNSDIIILTPIELDILLNKIPRDNFFVLYLKLSDEVIKKRLINRKDNKDVGLRRFYADKEDFKGFENKCDLVVTEEFFNVKNIFESIKNKLI